MIRIVKNGKYRAASVMLNKSINGQHDGVGFPITESMLGAFGSFPEITVDNIISISDEEYSLRADAFKTYLINKYSFLNSGMFTNQPFGTGNPECVSGTIIEERFIIITPDTKITIYFDSSGSMNSTLDPLTQMRNTLLKNHLLPLYNNDEVLYDQMVRIINNSSERTFNMLANLSTGLEGKNLIMVFQDEAEPNYTGVYSMENRRLFLTADIETLRTRLETVPQNNYRGVIFQVQALFPEFPVPNIDTYQNLLKAIKNGDHPNYPLPHNLSDKPEIQYEFDVTAGSSPEYYLDRILTKMRQLGYII